MEPYSIGVDLGGTNLRVAAIDPKGNVLDRVSVPAQYEHGPVPIVVQIVEVVQRVRADEQSAPGLDCPSRRGPRFDARPRR